MLVLKVDVVKWLAAIIQLIGYGLTRLNLTPWNIYLFFIGIILRCYVGIAWKDKAIIVVHVGVFIFIACWLFECIEAVFSSDGCRV